MPIQSILHNPFHDFIPAVSGGRWLERRLERNPGERELDAEPAVGGLAASCRVDPRWTSK
jgi:hypothetical protein